MRRLIIPSACLALMMTTALAQMPPTPPPGGPAALGQQVDLQGTVRAFTMTPVGDLEGMVLTDGNEIHVPPHLSAQLAAAVHPGETVRVLGWRTNVPNFVVATGLTGQRGQSVVDQGPPPPGMRPPPPPPGLPAPGAQQATLRGRIQQALHGPAGDVNGALLEDGTVLKFGPPVAWRASATLQPGQSVTAQGWTISNPYGRVMVVESVGSDTAQAAPPPPGAPPSPFGAPPAPRADAPTPPPPPGAPPPPQADAPPAAKPL
jgi:hypothetical protein